MEDLHQLDEALGRFPHIIESIIDLLSNEEICKLREVSQTWQNFVDTPRMFDWRLSNKGEEYSNYFYHLHPHEDQWGQTNLHFAAMTGQCQVVELKLEEENSKSEIEKENQVDGTGRMPLHYAAEKGHTNVVEQLLEVAESKNPEDNNRYTPLHLAAENGHICVVKIILDSVENKNPDGKWPSRTPLFWAVTKKHSEVWRAIIDSLNQKDLIINLHWAVSNGYCEVFSAIVDRLDPNNFEASDASALLNQALHRAGRQNHYTIRMQMRMLNLIFDKLIDNFDKPFPYLEKQWNKYKADEEKEKNTYYCGLCRISCRCQNDLEKHFAGMKHKYKANGEKINLTKRKIIQEHEDVKIHSKQARQS